MALLGKAALAMWWDIAPEQRAEFEDWHAHEHFPERLSIPGFQRGSRWSGTNGACFIMYELETYETLTSPRYLERLNAPTPWSTKMMPHHRNMVRSQCRVAASFGGGVATSLATIRLSAEAGKDEALKAAIIERLHELPTKPGLTGAHLLLTDTPATSARTIEQRLRGSDGVADWIVLLSGYDADVVERTVAGQLSTPALHRAGARETMMIGQYRLAYTMTPQDVAPL